MIAPYPRVRIRRHELMRELNTRARDQPWGPFGALMAVKTLDQLLELTTAGRFRLVVIDKARMPVPVLTGGLITPVEALQLAKREGTTNDGMGA